MCYIDVEYPDLQPYKMHLCSFHKSFIWDLVECGPSEEVVGNDIPNNHLCGDMGVKPAISRSFFHHRCLAILSHPDCRIDKAFVGVGESIVQLRFRLVKAFDPFEVRFWISIFFLNPWLGIFQLSVVIVRSHGG